MQFKLDDHRLCSVALMMCVLLLVNGCQSTGAPAPVANIGERGKTHIVQKGDTLYSIAWRYGLDHGRLAQINRIRKPYTIYAGQRLKLAGVPARLSSQSKASSDKPAPKIRSQAQNGVCLKAGFKTETSFYGESIELVMAC